MIFHYLKKSMKIEYRELFDNDLSNLDSNYLKRVFEKINLMKTSENITSLTNLKKLKWYKNFYRLRIWDYRLWFALEKDKIILERFLHRKDIYKYFPR